MAEKFIRRIFDDQVATDGKKKMGILFTKKFERRVFLLTQEAGPGFGKDRINIAFCFEGI